MKRKTLLIPLILLFAVAVFSQPVKENPFNKIDITFQLEAEPTIEDVGFDNPKSSWSVNYEIYIADFAELEKLGKCGFIEGRTIKSCSNLTDQKLDKQIKKTAHRISKGKFSQKRLSDGGNRKVSRSIILTPKAIEIFQEARKVYEKNPVLIVYVDSKISTKNSAGTKLKSKYKVEAFNWWKIYKRDNKTDYFNFSNAMFTLIVQKNPDNSLEIKVGYIQYG
jgi:hypothetical protein